MATPSPSEAPEAPGTGNIPPTQFRCPILGCIYTTPHKRGRADFIEHIESHTKPYLCCVNDCGMDFSRMSNLNRHRQTQHSLPEAFNLRTEDVIEIGETHYRIRTYQTLDELIPLLQDLGFKCSWAENGPEDCQS